MLKDKTVVRVQAISGLIFATFLVLHIGNLAASLLGQASYDRYMRTMRFYYQFPAVEIAAVVTALVAHVAAAIIRIRRRRAASADRSIQPTWRVRLHRYSGYVLLTAAFGHMAATRIPGLMGHPADFSFLHFSLAYMPWFFYPYYFLFALSGLYHTTHGIIVALRVVGAKLPSGATSPRSRLFWAWSGLSTLVVVGGLLALGGKLYAVDATRFGEWKGFYGELLPEGWRPW